VRVWEDTVSLPTYEEGPPDPNPPFDYFAPRRINYPYTIRNNLTDRRVSKSWRALMLENEYLKCVVLPDLGGHLYSCTDKLNGAEMFYANPSIKLTQIGYRGAWAALGIEFNFPVSHNWMTTSPVDYAITTEPDGSGSVWVGNIDRVHGMQWTVQLTIRPGRTVLEQHATLYNRSDSRHRFYWWTNAAVEVWDDSRIIYPMRFTASHGFRDVDTWPVDSRGVDNSVVGNHRYGPVSRFSHGSREAYMAVYHPRTRAGVAHYSPALDLPAKKIWSWSSDADGLDWRRALSDNNSAYVEIQAGLFRDQETYGFLEPQQVVRFSEYWMPIRDLGGLVRANPNALLNMTRRADGDGTTGVDIALNVTRLFDDAVITLRSGSETVATEEVHLNPATTFRRQYTGLRAEAQYTVEVQSSAGTLVITHTEGEYDYTPASEIKVGVQPTHSYPPLEERSEGEFFTVGDDQERNGRRLEAMETYRAGLSRFPDSYGLHKAAGRLAVALKQYETATTHLQSALERVSNDYEALYYLGHALAARGQTERARLAWEASQRYGRFRPASLFSLAAAAARQGNLEEALALLGEAVEGAPGAVRAGGLEVALLRTTGHRTEASTRLARWLDVDPTSSLLRHEAVRLGGRDEALWRHLAGDPERIIEIAVDYLRFGLFAEALTLLERDFPDGSGVVREPGAPSPESYPLIAYYRGYCRDALGGDGSADFTAAARMPTAYVFPNRAETLDVLLHAIAHDPADATAHFLLGSVYLSGGMMDQAMEAWETARELNPRIPVLHRNMGYTLLHAGASPERAIALFSEGTRVDERNVGLYFGLDQAMTRAGRSPGERADAMLAYPDLASMPASLVYQLARTLADAARFEEAENLFRERFFPREEGGTNVREVYLDVRVERAEALGAAGQCEEALNVVDRLNQEVAGLSFTRDGLQTFIEVPDFQQRVGEVRAACGER
jgi:tetratricopeptide (TPR) repeat protein